MTAKGEGHEEISGAGPEVREVAAGSRRRCAGAVPDRADDLDLLHQGVLNGTAKEQEYRPVVLYSRPVCYRWYPLTVFCR